MPKQESGVESQGSGLATRIAVFLITLSGLILEIGLTRIYSGSTLTRGNAGQAN
jgi:hypothetical protein